jgi:hypothetical protein
MGSIAELQNILDENKENLPDGVYLKMCDALKAEFDQKNEEEKNNTSYYNITFIKPRFIMKSLGVNEGNAYLQLLNTTRRIARLRDIDAKDIMIQLKKDGIAAGNMYKHNSRYSVISASDDGESHETVCIETHSMIVKIEKL